jgi:hypothetical protein
MEFGAQGPVGAGCGAYTAAGLVGAYSRIGSGGNPMITVGNKKHLFGPSLGQARRITAAEFQGRYHVGIRVDRVENQKPAYNGLNIPPAFYAPGKFKSGNGGKRNQMKGIPYVELFPEKGAGEVIGHFGV